MKVKNIFRIIACLLMVFILFSGCGQEGKVASYSEKKGETKEFVPGEDLIGKPYIILAVDTMVQQIMLKDYSSGRQLLYSYNLSTEFLDKYGGYNSITDFIPGKVCTIDKMDVGGLISRIRLSDEVWEKDGIRNFSIDGERGIFTIGVTNYRIPEDVLVFSDVVESDIASIGENDILSLVGQDKDIWSIRITTGHGTLSLINTSAFDGSLISVGNIYALIQGDMSLEVPEGEYDVTVANKGYGGSARVNVVRDNAVTLDLNTMQGEVKYCNLTFNIEVPEAVIKIDNTPVAVDQVLQVTYGRHTLSVEAPGYENWKKYLFVNSPTATIMLEMDKEGASNGKSQSSSGQNSSSSTGNNTNGNTGVTSSGSTTSTSKTEKEKRQETQLEYLSTLRDTVSSMMNSLGN